MAILNRYSTGKMSQASGAGRVKPLADDDQALNKPIIDPRTAAIGNVKRNLGAAPVTNVQTSDRQAAKDAAKENAKQVQRDSVHAEADKFNDENAITNLASLRATQQKERDAAKTELDAQRGRDLQDVDSRAGLGGFGLSGAATALRSDTNASDTRSSIASLADLRAKQRTEQGETLTREIAINDAEDADNTDYDNNNKIAGQSDRTPDDAATKDVRDQYLKDHPFQGDDYAVGDKNTEAGTIEEPFIVAADQLDDLKANGFTFTRTGRYVRGREVMTDGDGHFFFITGPKGTLGNE